MGHVLVTGASGFLGGQLMTRLAAEGIPALGIGRDPTRLAALSAAGHAVLAHDLTRPLSAAAHPALAQVDRIVHAAALSSPFGPLAAFQAANVNATANLLEFAQAQRVRRVVHISSPTVGFAFRDQLNQSEDAPLPPPVNAYAKTKAEAEALMRAAPGLGPVILRPRGIYGAGDTALLPRLLRAARRRPLPLFRGGRARIDLTHVDDVVTAILAAVQAGPEAEGQVINISGGEVLPVRDIAEAACARAGVALRWRALPLRPAMAAAGLAEAIALRLPGQPEPVVTRYGLGLFAYAQSLDLSKARRLLDWQPQVPFEAGLSRSFAGQVGA